MQRRAPRRNETGFRASFPGSRKRRDDFANAVLEAYRTQEGRLFWIVNYERTAIAPEIAEHYGERIKWPQDTYALSAARYSSSVFTRSTLRYFSISNVVILIAEFAAL